MQTHMTVPATSGIAAQQARIIFLPVRGEATAAAADAPSAGRSAARGPVATGSPESGRDAAAAPASVRLEITRRGRAVLAALAFLLGLLVASVLILAFDVPSALAGQEEAEGEVVTVAAGDTLWDYAERFAPEGVSEQEYIAQLRTLNHLPTGRVTAGQQIVLPASGALED